MLIATERVAGALLAAREREPDSGREELESFAHSWCRRFDSGPRHFLKSLHVAHFSA
jgi:hypothetical protein